jgi:predicted flap endonuclease-1-like 5' DNA nuclease
MNDWVGLLVVVVIIFIVWWLLARSAKQGPEEFYIERHHEVEPHLNETASRTNSVSTPQTPSGPDDLTILEGIGPKVNKILQARGITTFYQLAETKVDYLKTILEENELQFMDPETWPKQSRLAAEGKMDELKALMDSLKGGREV